jgi:Flagellar biosynthesis protein, FliO
MSIEIISQAPTEKVGRAKGGIRWSRHVRDLWGRILRFSQRPPRRLRLCESLPLGERRFVAVVEFERSRFLVGGTSQSLALLARLGNTDEPDHDKHDREGPR